MSARPPRKSPALRKSSARKGALRKSSAGKGALRTSAASKGKTRKGVRPMKKPAGVSSSGSPSTGTPVALQPDQLAALRQQLDARIADAMPARWNPDPDEVRRAVMKLVLTIAEFVRQLLERQAVRRMEAQTLTPEQIEAVGLALMRLEEAVQDLAKQSGLEAADLNLDLGPLGRLL